MHCILIQEEKVKFMALEIGTGMRELSRELQNSSICVASEGKSGMVHISEVADVYVNEIRDFVSEGQTVKVKVISIGNDGKISLSMKKRWRALSRAGINPLTDRIPHLKSPVRKRNRNIPFSPEILTLIGLPPKAEMPPLRT